MTIDSEKLATINSLIEELYSLKISTNMDFVNQRQRSIKILFRDYYVKDNWRPDKKTLNNILPTFNYLKEYVSEAREEKNKNDAICSCGKHFNIKRKQAGYHTCLDCGEKAALKSSPKIDEGLPGSREDHKKMRVQVWGGVQSRNKGN